MHEYRVTWEIDVSGETPEEAAREARRYQLDPTAQVGNFTVEMRVQGTDRFYLPVEVDLTPDEPSE